METEQTDSCQRKGSLGGWWKKGEESSQRTRMNDPWTWTTAWGWTVGDGGVGWMEEDKGVKIGTTLIE